MTLKKTMIFIILILFIFSFSTLFGENNLFIGIAILIQGAMLLSQDLSNKPIKNFVKIAILNIIIGLSGFLTCQFVKLEFFIVFLLIFSIIYFTKDNFEKRAYYPFILEFMFILTKPISLTELNTRLLSLIIGSLFVVGINLCINKKRLKKSQNNIKEEFNKINSKIKDNTNAKNSNKTLPNKENNENTAINTNNSLSPNKLKKEALKNLNYIKIEFAIKLAILISIFEFIAIYFNIANAKWLSFTALAVIQPSPEITNKKGKNRITGTIIGTGIFITLYILILSQNNVLESKNYIFITEVLMFLSSYLYIINFIKLRNRYDIQMILISLLSLSASSLTIQGPDFIIQRLLYIIIGTLLCLIANYTLFNHKLEKKIVKKIIK